MMDRFLTQSAHSLKGKNIEGTAFPAEIGGYLGELECVSRATDRSLRLEVVQHDILCREWNRKDPKVS